MHPPAFHVIASNIYSDDGPAGCMATESILHINTYYTCWLFGQCCAGPLTTSYVRITSLVRLPNFASFAGVNADHMQTTLWSATTFFFLVPSADQITELAV